MRKILLVLAAWGFILQGCASAPDIHKAAREGDTAGITRMMDEGVFPDVPDQWGDRPLHYASDGGHLEVARALLDKGADPNGVNARDWRPVHYACDPAVLALLLERGADSNTKTRDDLTPLHEVLRCPEKEHTLARMLIEAGGRINDQDALGLTPLHIAAGYADAAVAQLLIDSGAEVNTENVQGLTARDIAAVLGKDAVVDILDKNGGRSRKYSSKDDTKARFERGKLLGTESAVPMKKSFEKESGFAYMELKLDKDGVDTTATAFGPYSHYTYKGFDTVFGRFFVEPGHTYVIDAQNQIGTKKAYASIKDKETKQVIGILR